MKKKINNLILECNLGRSFSLEGKIFTVISSVLLPTKAFTTQEYMYVHKYIDIYAQINR